MPRRLMIHNASGNEGPVLSVHSRVLDREKSVYFHIANRPLAYEWGDSRIVYIGTTSAGSERIMTSMAERAYDAFQLHGVNMIEVHEIGCSPRQNVQTWRKLERVCLLAFRGLYGEKPRLNTHGVGLVESDEFEYFNKDQIERFIELWE